MYPKFEGRWPCTAGVHFKFDPELPPGKRILPDSITNPDGTPFDLDKEYVMDYMTLKPDVLHQNDAIGFALNKILLNSVKLFSS